jgi:chemotaxis protein CheC
LSIDHASRALSKSLKAGAKIEMETTSIADISTITEQMNDNPLEMSGVLVNLEGDVPLKLLFLVPLEGVFKLSDLFMRKPVGTTTEFDEFTESVIQEVGNILASSISNVLVSDFGVKSTLSSPTVLNDFAGTIFSMFVMEEGMLTDELLLIETRFEISRVELECYLFLLPHVDSLETMVERCGVCK